jgi:hypothetical protein
MEQNTEQNTEQKWNKKFCSMKNGENCHFSSIQKIKKFDKKIYGMERVSTYSVI